MRSLDIDSAMQLLNPFRLASGFALFWKSGDPWMRHVRFEFLFLILGALAASAVPAQNPELPWIGPITANGKIKDIRSIRTEANVTVSDGLKYNTESLFIDPQRAALRMTYPDRVVVRAVEGKYFWTFDGKSETEGNDSTEEFVLGHQIHAQILFFSQLHPGDLRIGNSDFAGETTKEVFIEDGNSSWSVFYKDGWPEGMRLATGAGPTVMFEFSDWRGVAGISLPFVVRIDDGERRFKYSYSKIVFNEGNLAEFRAPASLLTDEQKLMRLHRVVMDDHYFGDASRMKAINSSPFTLVSDGEVHTMTDAEVDSGFDSIMTSRDYTVYDDLIRPIVKVSKDGSLGWVTVRVYAKGVRLGEEGEPTGPLEFTSAWTELYEKNNGEWRMIGNISNFASDRK